MKKLFDSKPIVNKSNGQMNFSIPKRKIDFKGKVPTKIKFEIKEVEYGNC